MSTYLQQFAERFAQLDGDHLDALENLYSEDITFRDPLHRIDGLKDLRAYFAQLYANAHDIRYVFAGADEVMPGQGYLRWTLQFRHPRLAGGRPVSCKAATTCNGATGCISTRTSSTPAPCSTSIFR